MGGADRQTAMLFSYLSPETPVPPDHPLRRIGSRVNAALDRLNARNVGKSVKVARFSAAC